MKSSTMSRRGFMVRATVAVGGMAAGAVFAGCAPTAQVSPKAEGEVAATQPPTAAESLITLRIQVRAGQLGQYQYDMFPEFMEQHPNIRIEGEDVPHGEISMKTELGWVSGDLPDILRAHNRWFHLGCHNGWYLALDDLLSSTDAVPDYDDFYQVAIENMKWEGKTYCMMEALHAGVGQCIFWNRNLIEAAGAEPPNPDMDIWELQELALKVSNPDEGNFGIQMALGTQGRLSNVIRSWGKPEYGPEGDTSSWLTSVDGRQFIFLDNAAAKEFLSNWLRPLLDARAHPKKEDAIQGGLFQAGKCAMFQGHPGWIRRAEIAIGDTWDFHSQDAIILPKGPGGRTGTCQEGDFECVYSKSEHPEEALRLMGFLTSYEGGMLATDLGGCWTGRDSVFSDPKWASGYPSFADVAAIWDAGIVEPYPLPWNLRDPEFSDAYTNLMDPLLQGTASWEEQAPIFQAEGQRIFDLDRP